MSVFFGTPQNIVRNHKVLINNIDINENRKW